MVLEGPILPGPASAGGGTRGALESGGSATPGQESSTRATTLWPFHRSAQRGGGGRHSGHGSAAATAWPAVRSSQPAQTQLCGPTDDGRNPRPARRAAALCVLRPALRRLPRQRGVRDSRGRRAGASPGDSPAALPAELFVSGEQADRDGSAGAARAAQEQDRRVVVGGDPARQIPVATADLPSAG